MSSELVSPVSGVGRGVSQIGTGSGRRRDSMACHKLVSAGAFKNRKWLDLGYRTNPVGRSVGRSLRLLIQPKRHSESRADRPYGGA